MVKAKRPHKGQIWHINGDPVAGKEFKGPHYYLVVTDTQINTALGTSICVPITSGGSRARTQNVTVYLDGSSTDTGNITGCILCYQLRSLDLIARKATYSATLNEDIFEEVLSNIIDIIDPQI
ncbi:TPA: type II toxin-antitoxin system PemK/MazF family toxin [Providencia alcalifaciens]